MSLTTVSLFCVALAFFAMAAYLIVVILSAKDDKCTAVVKQRTIAGAIVLIILGIAFLLVRNPVHEAMSSVLKSVSPRITIPGVEELTEFHDYIQTKFVESWALLSVFLVSTTVAYFVLVLPTIKACPVTNKDSPFAEVRSILGWTAIIAMTPGVGLLISVIYWSIAKSAHYSKEGTLHQQLKGFSDTEIQNKLKLFRPATVPNEEAATGAADAEARSPAVSSPQIDIRSEPAPQLPPQTQTRTEVEGAPGQDTPNESP